MYKQLLLAFFLLFIGFTLSAQDKKWSLEINYPFSVGDSFGSSNQGTIGAGLKYRFANLGKFRIGASLDATWFSTTVINDSDPIQEQDFRDFFFQPRFFAELPLANNRLSLSGGLGWTVSRSLLGVASFNESGEIEGEEWNNGINLNIGLSYHISSKLFIQTQYDFIYFSKANSPNRNVGLIKLGAGFKF